MKLSLPVLVAASSIILSPVAAFAQHVDVGPGGVSVHGGHGDGHRERSEHHHVEKKVDHHHGGHHGDRHETVVVKERHGGDRH